MIPIKSSTRDQIMEICQKHVVEPDKMYREMCYLFEAEYNGLVVDLDKLKREKNDLERKNDNAHEVLKQTGLRYNSQLMSVYYLLGSLQSVGTHHEKEVVIRFIRQTINDLLDKGGDKLSWDQDLLPF